MAPAPATRSNTTSVNIIIKKLAPSIIHTRNHTMSHETPRSTETQDNPLRTTEQTKTSYTHVTTRITTQGYELGNTHQPPNNSTKNNHETTKPLRKISPFSHSNPDTTEYRIHDTELQLQRLQPDSKAVIHDQEAVYRTLSNTFKI